MIMQQTFRRIEIFCCLLCIASTSVAGAADSWHTRLYLSGGDWWRKRVRLVLRNRTEKPLNGAPVSVVIGKAPEGGGEKGGSSALMLAGENAAQIRLCNEKGTGLLFGLRDPAGLALRSGVIPEGSTLVLPAACPPQGKAVYYVYYDNPSAGSVNEFLPFRTGLVNGDAERGADGIPSGWELDEGDAAHRVYWSREAPQSGGRCFKTVVAEEAEPTWIAARQGKIHVSAGAEYRFQAWVRAENVKGYAGWYLHIGNASDSMITAPLIRAGDGTFGWKKTAAVFKVPATADTLSLGTVLRGTGTAWFDAASLACLSGRTQVSVETGRYETFNLTVRGRKKSWHGNVFENGKTDGCRNRRMVLKVFNFLDQDRDDVLVHAQAPLTARLGVDPARDAVRIVNGHDVLSPFQIGGTLFFRMPFAGSTLNYLYLYSKKNDAKKDARAPFSFETDAAFRSEYAALLGSALNLVKDPAFEAPAGRAESWTASGDQPASVAIAFDRTGKALFGKACGSIVVPPETEDPAWRGWHQSIRVEPGKTYFLAAFLEGENIAGEARVHVHMRKPDGALSAYNAMRSAGPGISGTTGWRLVSGAFQVPPDATLFQIHLTMNATGTLLHDGILLAETVPAEVAGVEGRLPPGAPDPVMWQVNAIKKVFPDCVPPSGRKPARITLARNEKEPLQVAVRSQKEMDDVEIRVAAPSNAEGRTLDRIRINVAGYVPIDAPTNYYRSEAPSWERRRPLKDAGSDGWAGLWPDPLFPRNRLSLKAGKTHAVWITFQAGPKAAAGSYRGIVNLLSKGKEIASLSFTVHVWDFSLPETSHVAAIYDVRHGPGGRRWWGKDTDALYAEVVRFMAEYRLCPDRIRPSSRLFYRNGKAGGDFTAFDRAASLYFDELHFPFSYMPWHFYLFGWGHPPHVLFGEKPYEGDPPYEDADRSRIRPEFKTVYQACLQLFWNHVKERGWQDKFVLYISDEPFFREEHIVEQMRALCDMIHEVDPAIPIYSSTWEYVPQWKGYLDIWGIGHYGRVPVDRMEAIRSAKDRIWFTTDGQMCTDTPLCAVERLLPHYCFKYGAEAYEFWGVSWLTYNPYECGWHAYIHQSSKPGVSFYVRYPNGDGFLLYPGKPVGHKGPVPSIRLEQAREGVEDYEYLYLLKHLVQKAEKTGRAVPEALSVLQKADILVTIPNAGGRYSSRILPDPDQVLRLKEEMARVLERLNR